jgi:hypothetical protein
MSGKPVSEDLRYVAAEAPGHHCKVPVTASGLMRLHSPTVALSWREVYVDTPPLRQERSMPRFYFYSADLYTREETQLTGGYHGIMTVDDDAKSASEVFGEVADLLQSQTQEYIQEIAKNSGQPADPQMFYFVIKQFYKVD